MSMYIYISETEMQMDLLTGIAERYNVSIRTFEAIDGDEWNMTYSLGDIFKRAMRVVMKPKFT